MLFAVLRVMFTSLLPRECLLAGDVQHRDVSLAGDAPALAEWVGGLAASMRRPAEEWWFWGLPRR